MKLQQLMSPVRRAIDDYNMIEDGDRIAIGMSGGKDSTALLFALNGLSKYYPKKFEIEAIAVDLGLGMDFTPIKEMCDSINVRFTVVKTDISKIVFEERKEKNPCSLCSKLRKGALNNQARELGCNKIAFGHHKDDLVETMMMSLVFEGQFYCFPPVMHYEDSDLSIIRPLMYVREADVRGFINKYQLPIVKNKCPADGVTNRQYFKDLVKKLNMDFPGAKERLFTAITTGNVPLWPEKVR